MGERKGTLLELVAEMLLPSTTVTQSQPSVPPPSLRLPPLQVEEVTGEGLLSSASGFGFPLVAGVSRVMKVAARVVRIVAAKSHHCYTFPLKWQRCCCCCRDDIRDVVIGAV